ncbi:neuroligin-2-like [Palaemon carinicauda]|uniref:neuroligin-2-like n=1 Tax=Palaemon carinicauda TaxID=392227 RepID=UPI0035B6395C
MTKDRYDRLRKYQPALKRQIAVLEPHLLDPSTTPNYPACILVDAALMAYPVVFFLHGESFEWGSSSLYDGSVLAALGKVIVVTLNYRLGILGFYNANPDPLGRPTLANYGLMDQLAALYWVQENIVHFGGDPGQVTVMGHGTGATCLNYLVISPAATGQYSIIGVLFLYKRRTTFICMFEIMLAITAEYTDWSRSLHQPISIRDSTRQGLHDANIVSPMRDLAKQLYTTSRSSYLYVLEEEGSDSGKESLLLEELAYVFGGPLGALGPLASSYNFTKMDVTLSKSFISMWSDFIKLGHPKDTVSTAKMSENGNNITSEEQIWPKYDPVYQRYFQIGTQNFVRDHYRAGKVALWSWLLPGLERVGIRYGPDKNFHRLPTDLQYGLYPELTGGV